MSVSVIAPEIAGLATFFETQHEKAEEAAVLAINQIASRDGVKAFREDILEQVNFPRGYLNKERLDVTQWATKGNLEAVVTGRDRPTSLHRFARFKTRTSKNGNKVSDVQDVTVKPGQTQTMKGAFEKKLKNGNVGLAFRTKKGETLKGSRAAIRLAENLYLLYGPSVNQVLGSIADENVPDLAQKLSNEFMRQYLRLMNDG